MLFYRHVVVRLNRPTQHPLEYFFGEDVFLPSVHFRSSYKSATDAWFATPPGGSPDSEGHMIKDARAPLYPEWSLQGKFTSLRVQLDCGHVYYLCSFRTGGYST